MPLVLAAGAGLLIPWTVGLAFVLPSTYNANHWSIAWTGFDVALAGCFALTAWALRHKSPVALPAAIVASVLLVSDAWFDLLTARVGACLAISAATAIFGELPLAALLARVAGRLWRESQPRPIPVVPVPAMPGHGAGVRTCAGTTAGRPPAAAGRARVIRRLPAHADAHRRP
jgi:hypothetical protein